MQSNKNNNPRTQENRLSEFPALASLRIKADDLEYLADQGFVCQERRGDRTYCKLRFRRSGKQVVRYIGSADCAATVKNELLRLQAESKFLRELKIRTKVASKILRNAKRTLEPVLQENGFVFHGFAIRRPYRPQNDAAIQSSS